MIPDNCISATLLSRLQVLGWHVGDQRLIHDHFGCFSLFGVSIAELTFRAQWAWQQVASEQVAHRPGFKHVYLADALDTRGYLKTLAPDELELFHKCLNGCHFTQDGKAHCQEGGTNICPFCNCTDSRFHRFWVCEYFASERRDVPDDVWQLIPGAPDYLTGYGWSLRPHTMFSWYQCLDSITLPEVVPIADVGMEVHVFTDGSCLNQAHPTCRLASWSVVLAAIDNGACRVVTSGPLPGIMQSSYRAEIFAVLKALQAMRMQTQRVHLWCDCQAVVSRMQRLLNGSEPKPTSAHSDLWREVFDALRDFLPEQVVITKVAAHQKVVEAASPLEEWCFIHNSHQGMRPTEFWTLFDQQVNTTIACRNFSRVVQRVLLRISKAVIKAEAEPDGDARADVGAPAVVPDGVWRPLGVLQVPAQAVRWYGDAAVRSILSWYWQATFESTSEVIWVSQFQLYLDFQLSGGCGPTKFDRWRDGSETPHLDLLSIPFQTRVRWFSKVLKESLRHHGQGSAYSYCRPFSKSLFLHTGCIAAPWCKQRINAIDDWILRFSPGGVFRNSKLIEVEGLPMAALDPSFPQVLLSTV